MITVLQSQSFTRWDTLPDVLREALFAEEVSDFVWKTCRAENIPEEKIFDVARIAGYVLFGFLHPEDMAVEIRDALKIDIRIATAIADAINKRIFTPLRPDIDKVYEPILGGKPSSAVGVRRFCKRLRRRFLSEQLAQVGLRKSQDRRCPISR